MRSKLFVRHAGDEHSEKQFSSSSQELEITQQQQHQVDEDDRSALSSAHASSGSCRSKPTRLMDALQRGVGILNDNYLERERTKQAFLSAPIDHTDRLRFSRPSEPETATQNRNSSTQSDNESASQSSEIDHSRSEQPNGESKNSLQSETNQSSVDSPKGKQLVSASACTKSVNFSFGKCKVCKDRATGIHYGVATCEGCKVI
jgi:hypothetical protein